MFHPPTLFFASRKANLLRRTLDAAGHPIGLAVARRTVAKAWGWSSWLELASALERPGELSPLDEDLVGPGAGAMAELNKLVVARRGGCATRALLLETGLPHQICIELSGFLRLTGRHPDGEWMSPQQFRRLYADCLAPKPQFVLDLIEGLRDGGRSSALSLPPHRPR